MAMPEINGHLERDLVAAVRAAINPPNDRAVEVVSMVLCRINHEKLRVLCPCEREPIPGRCLATVWGAWARSIVRELERAGLLSQPNGRQTPER